jgi:hypothetical protein
MRQLLKIQVAFLALQALPTRMRNHLAKLDGFVVASP